MYPTSWLDNQSIVIFIERECKAYPGASITILIVALPPRSVRLPIPLLRFSVVIFCASSIKSYGLGTKVQTFFCFFFVCFIWQQRPPSLLPSPWETLVPDSATSAMSTPCSCAMKPRTENIAKPDTKLVPLLRPPSSKQSLCHTYVMEVVNEHRRNRGSHFFFLFHATVSDTSCSH